MVSPEIRSGVDDGISLEAQLRKRYGASFLESYFSSKAISLGIDPQERIELPCFASLKPHLKDGITLRFVEWQNQGRADWRYVVTFSENRPGEKGKYFCHKVLRPEDGGKHWVQEVTKIETDQPLPLRDRVERSIRPSLETALQQRLGDSFCQEYCQAGFCSREEDDLKEFFKLRNYLPRGAQIKYLSNGQIDIPQVGMKGEETTLMEAYGKEFVAAYSQSKILRLNSLDDNTSQALPQFDLLKKSVIGKKRDLPFKYVEWVSSKGEPEFAYVFRWRTSRESTPRYHYRVVRPFTNRRGEIDLVSDFHTCLPSSFLEGKEDKVPRPCLVMEQTLGDQKLVQVLRVSDSVRGSFENVFIGLVDTNSNNCLVVNDLYPEVSFIQIPSLLKDKRTGIALSVRPVCYFSSLGLSKDLGFLRQYFSGKVNPAIFLGHELGHLADFRRVINEGEKACQKYRLSLESVFYTFFYPEMARTFIETVPLVFSGNPVSVIPGSLVLWANSVYKESLIGKEISADENLKLMVQAARENGVDLFGGMPDDQLPVVSRMILMRLARELNDFVTKQKIPNPLGRS